MKLNNKGVTIVELLVSMALLSVILMFLYNLLSNVTFEKNSDFIASANQSNRIDIIMTIEDDLLKDNNVTIVSKSDNGNELILKGSLKKYKITLVDNKSLAYDVSELSRDNWQIQNTWKIKNGTLGKIDCGNTNMNSLESNVNASECKSGSANSNLTCRDVINSYESIVITECKIPIYTTNVNNTKDNNNTLDDIIFSFIQ